MDANELIMQVVEAAFTGAAQQYAAEQVKAAFANHQYDGHDDLLAAIQTAVQQMAAEAENWPADQALVFVLQASADPESGVGVFNDDHQLCFNIRVFNRASFPVQLYDLLGMATVHGCDFNVPYRINEAEEVTIRPHGDHTFWIQATASGEWPTSIHQPQDGQRAARLNVDLKATAWGPWAGRGKTFVEAQAATWVPIFSTFEGRLHTEEEAILLVTDWLSKAVNRGEGMIKNLVELDRQLEIKPGTSQRLLSVLQNSESPTGWTVRVVGTLAMIQRKHRQARTIR